MMESNSSSNNNGLRDDRRRHQQHYHNINSNHPPTSPITKLHSTNSNHHLYPTTDNPNPNPSKHHKHLMLMDVLTRKSGSAQHGSCKKLAHITLYRLELMIDWNSSWPYHTSTIIKIHAGLFTFARKSKILWFHLALLKWVGVGVELEVECRIRSVVGVCCFRRSFDKAR